MSTVNGSLRQTRHGTWQARWRGPDGRERTKTCKTKGEARLALITVQMDVQKGTYVDPQAGKETVASYAKYWLANYHGRESTKASYTGVLDSYVLPHLGKVKLVDLDYDRLIRWLNALKVQTNTRTGEPLSPTTVHAAHRVLRSLLSGAVRSKRLPYNPAVGLPLPPKGKPKWKIITPPELEALLLELPTLMSQTLVLLALTTGLRWSEVAGLTWQNVRLDDAVIQVRSTLVEAGGRLHAGGPKSQTSVRDVPMTARLVDQLIQLRLHQPSTDDGLVFLSEYGHPLRRSNWHRQYWAPALSRAGLTGLRMHDLRHSAATWLIEGGTDIVTVKEILGHESIVTTQIYGHSSAARKRAAMDRTFGEGP